VEKVTPLKFNCIRAEKLLLFGHAAINALKINEVCELNGHFPALPRHRNTHFGVQKLSKKILEFQQASRLQRWRLSNATGLSGRLFITL
jgi:hypothetical protein